MVDFSFAAAAIYSQQTAQEIILFVLGSNLLLHFILIIAFLAVAWKSTSSKLGALKAEKVVLGLYIIFLVIDTLIYCFGILQGSLPYNPMIAGNPVFFFILFSPPVPLMYLGLRLPESSRLCTSLSNSGLILLIWLVVIFIAVGAIGTTIILL